MLSVISNNISLPIIPTLVATPLPESSALRVPTTNVAPSVANAQVDNNTQSNRNFTPSAGAQAAAPQVDGDSEFQPAYPPAGARSISAETTFLAQLAAQDDSPIAKVILVQYERLLSLGAVKYKPSNAGKPLPAISLFNALLKSAAPAAPQPKNDKPEPVVVEPKTSDAPQAPAPANDNVVEQAQSTPVHAAQSFAAYADTIRRNQDFIPEKTVESA